MTIDSTVTSTGVGLVAVCEPVEVPALVLVWTPSCIVDPSRIGERLLLQGQSVELNRQSPAFPGGRIDDREVSRVHARVSRGGGGRWTLTDLGSKNGTFVNGVPVSGDSGRVLEAGDVVRIGDSLMVYRDVLYPPPADADIPDYLGVSDAARDVRSAIGRYAGSALPVLVTGDSGVGKEVVSRAIAAKGRPGRPLVVFNAANVGSNLAGTMLFGNVKGAFTDAREARPGLFREADGGTLFIDEIGELPRDVQAQFLRVLEDGMVLAVGASKPVRVDVRVVAATNRDLRDPDVFRPDLYMRLAQLAIHVQPVRRRPEDIVLFALKFSGGRPFTVRSLERMLMHTWPLNVREIKGMVAQTVADSADDGTPLEFSRNVLNRMNESAAAFDADTRRDAPFTLGQAQVENALRETNGNMSEAAKMVGRDRAQFYRIVKKFGFNPDDFRR